MKNNTERIKACMKFARKHQSNPDKIKGFCGQMRQKWRFRTKIQNAVCGTAHSSTKPNSEVWGWQHHVVGMHFLSGDRGSC